MDGNGGKDERRGLQFGRVEENREKNLDERERGGFLETFFGRAERGEQKQCRNRCATMAKNGTGKDGGKNRGTNFSSESVGGGGGARKYYLCGFSILVVGDKVEQDSKRGGENMRHVGDLRTMGKR